MPFFSIIIPTFNRKALLQETLESVLSQRFTDYEIIVVDDGSTDGTVEYLSISGDRIMLLTQEHRGPGAARNLGAKHASGNYLAFLDSDDLWFPWTLENYFHAISTSNSEFIAGSPEPFHNRSELQKLPGGEFSNLLFPDYFSCGEYSTRIYGCCVAIKRDTFLKQRGFPSEMINGEDCDMWLQLGTLKNFIFITSPYSLGYRRHEGSAISLSSRTIKGVESMIRKETSGAYPGGPGRASERRSIITRHARPVALECLKSKADRKMGISIYWKIFWWNVRDRRLRYLLGFWAYWMKPARR